MTIPKPSADRLMKGQLIELLHFMKLNRLVEERLTNLYRQSKVVGGLYRSLGQEACSVGAAYALADDDVFTPLIRNLGAIFVRGGRPPGTSSASTWPAATAPRAAATSTPTR